MAADVLISKGDYSVIIYVSEITDNMTNKIFPISPGVGKQNQDSGPKDTKIVDLLRIVREINIQRGMITGTSALTAKQVKDNLITIFKGANQKGGTCTFVYDGNTFTGFIEKLTISEKASDIGTYWISGDNYVVGQIVEYGGSYYRCIQNATGRTTAPSSDTSYWTATTIGEDWAKYDVQLNFIVGTTVGG